MFITDEGHWRVLEDLAWHEGKWASLLGRFRKGKNRGKLIYCLAPSQEEEKLLSHKVQLFLYLSIRYNTIAPGMKRTQGRERPGVMSTEFTTH